MTEEAYVAPGVIYAFTPTDPTVQKFIEQYFEEECISVVWEDQRRIEDGD